MTDSRKLGSSAGNRGKGRKKGVPNKVTADARKAMELAFAGIGGVKQLTEWAGDNLTDFYKLWGRLIPNEQKVQATGTGTIEVVFRDEAGKPR